MAKNIPRYNASLRNISYRLRAFKDNLPGMLEDIIRDKEDIIVNAIRKDQLYRRGVNGDDKKIMDYAPYAQSTIRKKLKKGQPTTRVTLKDTGEFYDSMFVVFDSEGFYITSSSEKTKYLVKKYGNTIFKLTDKNFNRVLKNHIKKELIKRIKQAIKK